MKNTIDGLLKLTQLTADDSQILRRHSTVTEQWAGDLIKMFYDTLYEYGDTTALLHIAERTSREDTLKHWYLQIVKGDLSVDFWETQANIGARHVERGILNAYMQGMMNRMQSFFLEKCIDAFDTSEAIEVYHAFKRIPDTAAGIIAESYPSPYGLLKVRR